MHVVRNVVTVSVTAARRVVGCGAVLGAVTVLAARVMVCSEALDMMAHVHALPLIVGDSRRVCAG